MHFGASLAEFLAGCRAVAEECRAAVVYVGEGDAPRHL